MSTSNKGRALGALAALLLSACGGGDGSADTPAGTPATNPAPAPPPGPVPAPTPGSGDTQAPVAALTAPANLSAELDGSVALSATASDDVGVANVEFQVDGATLGTRVTAPPYAASLDTTQYASGQHVVRVRAADAAGNLSAWSAATVTFDGVRAQPAGFTRNEGWVTGLGDGTAFAQAPDGRWFVSTQGGALRVVKAGALLAAPFVQLAVDSSGERGLLGVAVHPNFASNGYVYVYYTTTENGTHNRLSRFTAAGDVAAANSEVKLVDLPALTSSATNHNGGGLHFGADGKLYIGVGENGNGANSQDPSTPLGKMLRVNDDGTIPADNPFAATRTGLARAVWASGLRNPFTFAFQSGSGRLFINDVGQDTWEEINLGAAGANYGWPGSEGGDNLSSGITAPLFTYKHSATSPPGSGPGGFFTGAAITGGDFYPGAGPFPAMYQGSYFFADYGSAFVARFDPANSAAYAFGRLSGSPVDLRVGLDGALYVLTRDTIVRFSSP
ncbi:MAG TPA: PQQ-dependent sugar dehydrogenase [Burkholderiaceae bacterium]|jgi:glucose/arabinose dehydrogenase